MEFDVLIVGGGQGGAQTALALRRRGYEGRIGIVSDEPDLPYERPPLSKDYLSGTRAFETLLLRPPGWWVQMGVTFVLSTRIEAVDPVARCVVHRGGETGYGVLVWATGGRPRGLSCEGGALAGVHCLRDRRDADRIRAELKTARRVVIVGGGYIGLEAASVMVKAGLQVTVLEAQDRILARVASPMLSDFLQARHAAEGVDIRTNCLVERLHGRDGRATEVELAGGTRLPADLVLAGIGIVPNVEPLLQANAEGGGPGVDGVAVDGFCRTSLPDVYAIGDGAAHVSAFAGGRQVRLESIQNADGMAQSVANHITGEAAPYSDTPWFWSHQYDLQLQSAGLCMNYDRVVVRGEIASARFSLVYLSGGRIRALDCINTPREFAQGKVLVGQGAPMNEALLADAAVPLRQAAL
jgi:3-phenylpropionate/trans-cinnamate dioxygenase ferredoxin reductase subunit